MAFPGLGLVTAAAVKLTPLGGILKRVGAFLGKTVSLRLPLWLILGMLAAGLLWHNGKVRDAYRAGVAFENKRLADEIAALGEQIRRKGEDLSAFVRSKLDEANRRTNADAHALSVSGPGKAEYRCPAAVPASGHDPRPRTPDVAAPAVPGGDRLAVVPWGWLTSHAATCDLNLNEVNAWRSFYPQIVKLWGEGGPSKPAEAK